MGDFKTVYQVIQQESLVAFKGVEIVTQVYVDFGEV